MRSTHFSDTSSRAWPFIFKPWVGVSLKIGVAQTLQQFDVMGLMIRQIQNLNNLNIRKYWKI